MPPNAGHHPGLCNVRGPFEGGAREQALGWAAGVDDYGSGHRLVAPCHGGDHSTHPLQVSLAEQTVFPICSAAIWIAAFWILLWCCSECARAPSLQPMELQLLCTGALQQSEACISCPPPPPGLLGPLVTWLLHPALQVRLGAAVRTGHWAVAQGDCGNQAQPAAGWWQLAMVAARFPRMRQGKWKGVVLGAHVLSAEGTPPQPAFGCWGQLADWLHQEMLEP